MPSASFVYGLLTGEPTIATPSAPETIRATVLVAEAARGLPESSLALDAPVTSGTTGP